MEPQHINENIAFLIGQATHLYYRCVSNAFREKKLEVTVEQFSVLTLLWYEDGLLQKEIARQLNRDKTTLTRVITNMEKRNLVVRIPDKTDRRVNHIHLTFLGRELQKTLIETTGSVYMKSIKGIKREELELLINLLNKIIDNLK
jgi:DNA-binding MarR family transcriptional regulator